MSEAIATVAKYAETIDREIVAELEIGLDEWMRQAIYYHFGWVDANFQPVQGGRSGKKLRPAMAILSYLGALESVQPGSSENAKLDPVLPVATCIEMIHNFSLIHDDIEDEDEQRHGRTTLWALVGKPKAINVGDCLDNLAYRKLFRALERGVEANRVAALAATIADTSVKLTLGQQLDMSFEDDLDVTPEMYLRMIRGKSAVLISCATYCGALTALEPGLAKNAEKLNNYRDFGISIGLGFQIRDDILGIWGATTDTGKASGNDIRRRKKSLPIIYALSQTTGDRREKLLDIYRSNEPVTEVQVQFVMDALDDCGARRYAQEQADAHKAAALAALTTAAGDSETLAANRPLRQLQELSTFLVERNY
jgi:geranylgeranyl diphosphate synthase, type I